MSKCFAKILSLISPLPFVFVTFAFAGSEETSKLDMLKGSTWQWIRLVDPEQEINVKAPERYTITFEKDGLVSILADCNRARGKYTTDEDGGITFEVGPMTKVQCPPESLSDEFVKKLAYLSHFFFREDHLYIDMFADGGTFEFQPEVLKAKHYSCEDGTKLDVSFQEGNPSRAELVIGNVKTMLTLSQPASGSKYTKEDTKFWMKGDNAIYEVKGRSTNCTLTQE